MSLKGPPWRKGIIILQQLDRRMPVISIGKVLERETKWNEKGFRFERLPAPSMTMILRYPKKGKRTSRKCFRFMDKNPRIKRTFQNLRNFRNPRCTWCVSLYFGRQGWFLMGAGCFIGSSSIFRGYVGCFIVFSRKAPENSSLSKLLSVSPPCTSLAVLHQRTKHREKRVTMINFPLFPFSMDFLVISSVVEKKSDFRRWNISLCHFHLIHLNRNPVFVIRLRVKAENAPSRTGYQQWQWNNSVFLLEMSISVERRTQLVNMKWFY